MLVGHIETALPVPVAPGGVVPARPVLPFGVQDLELDPLGDHHRIPRGGEPQQQPRLLLTFLRLLTDAFRRINNVLLVLLRNSEHFHGTLIMRPKPFKDLHQRPVRSRGEHVFRLLVLRQKHWHDQRRDLPLIRFLTQRSPNGLHDVHGRPLRVQEGYGIHRPNIDALTQYTAI
ncbi:hypothetical protein [Streptomyces sp. NPDC002994]|uniref:hypothetical protein n=1 Tax=Streptomyces sp. NPDC002994 TaxID=3154441 RepID=UPI0033BFB55B